MVSLHLRKLLVLALVLVLPASTGLGATIQTLVRILPQGSPVDTIRLTIARLGGGYNRTVTLTGERSFAFAGVRSGVYSITAESPGFDLSETQVELNSFGRADHALATITLRKSPQSDTTQPSGRDTTVSVKTLRMPSKAQQEMDRAAKASAAGQPEKAIEHLRKAIQVYPDAYQAYNNLAVEYVRLGKTDLAISSLEESIRIEPHDSTSQRNLAELYLSAQAFEKALELLGESLRIEPESSKTLMLLGETQLGLKHHGVALGNFEKAAALNPEHHSFIGMALCYLTLGRPGEALIEFREFIQHHPDDPRVPPVLDAISQLERQLAPVQ